MAREREYIQRRSGTTGRSTVGRSRKQQGPPPFLLLALALIIVIVLVVLIAHFVRSAGNEEPDSSNPSSSSSQVSSQIPDQSSQSGLTSSPEISSTPALTPPPEKVPDGDPEKLDALLKIGDTGYEWYNFVEDRANQYITTVSNLGTALSGSATLYDMVIPTSMDIMLPESYIEQNNIQSQNQSKAIDYIYSSINAMNPNVKTVPIFDALKLHNNEYLYFRTDHHWTQLGAYYAYAELCNAKGIAANPLDSYEKKEYPGFLGSFYNDCLSAEMQSNPDTVEAYVSSASTSLTFTDASGNVTYGWPVIQDGTDYSTGNKYLIFCAADQPYEEITNYDLSDGSACLVVKESFGNVLIPFLTDHYQTVYVVDYRYYTGNIVSLAQEKNVSDVFLLNNISMTRNESLISDLTNSF